MDSDDNLSDDDSPHFESPPFLRLFDEIETNGRLAGRKDVTMKKAVRFFSVQRFFRSIEGFYMGSLDLTGRHTTRLQKLQARWNAFLHDFLTLALHAREYSVLDYGGHEVPKYQFLDEIIYLSEMENS
ncbi:hypothetical protein Hypma_012183 [Hypsizygus marmoreus]|uniref:Uncharacterized protein n=1 Tax=Hypsizygus marmoreus TaxID=39966 RepID=A0A369JPG4_HYPMA|nr:hypothetical protein Hypma_012183 [Hypsizygus marmoreus]